MEQSVRVVRQSAHIEVTEQARESLAGILKKEGASVVRLFIEGFG